MINNLLAGLLPAAVLLTAGCASEEKREYNVTLLGDIHFDAARYHDYSKFGVSKEGWAVFEKSKLNADGYYSSRSNTLWNTKYLSDTRGNTVKNIEMWEKYMPTLMQETGECAEKSDSLYLFQVGDMIHGDCGKLQWHKDNLQEALDIMQKYVKSPVLVACGNHDPRGPEGQRAWNEVVNPHLDRASGNAPRKDGNFYFTIGPDLYYFHDMMNPDLDFLEKALTEHRDARYKFFISHQPVLPEHRNHCKEILTDDFKRLFPMLEAAEVIVIAGHTHWVSLAQYKNPVTGKRISQLILNSTVRYPESQLNFKPEIRSFSQKMSDDCRRNLPLYDKYFDGNVKTVLCTNGAGHALMRVSDEGVFIDYHNSTQKEVHTYKLR